MSCKAICETKIGSIRPISRNTGHLPRCIGCGYAYQEDLGQIKCPCCKAHLRRSTR